MVITLTPELEKALAERAKRLGTTPESLALNSLRERFVPVNTTPAQGTMADFLADYIGILHSTDYIKGGAQMSEDSGKKFTAILLKKHQRRRK